MSSSNPITLSSDENASSNSSLERWKKNYLASSPNRGEDNSSLSSYVSPYEDTDEETSSKAVSMPSLADQPPPPRPLKSPFLPSSEDDSGENPSDAAEDSDDSSKKRTSNLKSSSSQPQPRPRARNPPLPEDREVVLGLCAPSYGASSHIVTRKGKRKMK